MKNALSIKVLYLLTRIAYWGIIIIMVIVGTMGIIIITLDPQGPSLGFSTNLTYSEEVLYLENDPGTPVEVEFSAEELKIPVRYMDTPTKFSVLLMSMTWLVCVWFIAKYFKTFMAKVKEGEIFQIETVDLIKRAALGFVILEAIELIMRIVGHFYVLRKFDLGKLQYEFDWEILSTNLIVALVLWVLAHIFQKGRELEEEQKLTI